MSELNHPSIVFQVNTETVNKLSFLPPDRHQDDQDNAQSEMNNHRNNRSVWLPGFLVGENRSLKHGEQFTLTGSKAVYVRDTYTNGVVGDTSGIPLYIVSSDSGTAVSGALTPSTNPPA